MPGGTGEAASPSCGSQSWLSYLLPAQPQLSASQGLVALCPAGTAQAGLLLHKPRGVLHLGVFVDSVPWTCAPWQLWSLDLPKIQTLWPPCADLPALLN